MIRLSLKLREDTFGSVWQNTVIVFQNLRMRKRTRVVLKAPYVLTCRLLDMILVRFVSVQGSSVRLPCEGFDCEMHVFSDRCPIRLQGLAVCLFRRRSSVVIVERAAKIENARGTAQKRRQSEERGSLRERF